MCVVMAVRPSVRVGIGFPQKCHPSRAEIGFPASLCVCVWFAVVYEIDHKSTKLLLSLALNEDFERSTDEKFEFHNHNNSQKSNFMRIGTT